MSGRWRTMMASTDTTERGLERLICLNLTGHPCDPGEAEKMAERAGEYSGTGWVGGNPNDYDREFCVDLAQLGNFLRNSQPDVVEALALDQDCPARRKFLLRLQNEVGKRGVIDVLRHGIKHQVHDLSLLYGTPTIGNDEARARFEVNRFSVTRQLRYSLDQTRLALDLVLFINGLPVATLELKNNLTKQSVEDAVRQYKRDRNPREKLFQFGRCVAHFAVDENEVRFCTKLAGKESYFLPFNRGWDDGAGNPPNPNGLKTDYFWRETLTRESLTNILENYAQVITTKDDKSGKEGKTQIWPRYHQLDVVQRLLADAEANGAGRRYLIQHSAGSGKSNSIAWLAYQLLGLNRENELLFDSIIVVTDRLVLDRQIRDTIKQFVQVSAIVGHAERSGDLRRFIEGDKKLIISTVQKFPFILDEIGDKKRSRHFAILIDEAHSSQGGKTSAAISQALSEDDEEAESETFEDQINKLVEARRLLPNASYFAFTATPKAKTLEIFGKPAPQADGTTKYLPFHSYTMKQAIQEGFILDVLAHYTPVESYYKLIKTVEDDPRFDAKRAGKKLRRYVEGHEHAIRLKAELMVDHFLKQVAVRSKLGGQARAMVVTNGVARAIRYFHKISAYLTECKSQYKAIVAFSGEHEYAGVKVTEASLNHFSSNEITDKIRQEPYRFLICADKFQTGYDEPLLHTMYVDKTLSGIKAVQTLSRLNRAHPRKHDVFVLDFMNDIDTIRDSFADYYRTTILAEETDPNRLHDLKAELDSHQVYTPAQIKEFVEKYLGGVERDMLDPLLDTSVEIYQRQLDEDNQVKFKGKAKSFIRTYSFLSSILPYINAEWEQLSIFLNFLVLKLPAPVEEDLSQGILNAIDMDSYRVEKLAVKEIGIPDQDAEIEPLPLDGGAGTSGTEMERLSNILNDFNNRFGNIRWEDEDRIQKLITEEIPKQVIANPAYRNARENSDKQNARIEHDKALERVMANLLRDDTELCKQFMDNDGFKRWMTDAVFRLTYQQRAD